MANETEKTKPNEDEEEEEEPKIPVFTVLKNGAILKNIFIVNKSPPPPHSKPISPVRQGPQEEILIVGRHPDCNIVLTHPSVSRFHLQILSDPRAQKLCVTDLSSVHGTWVSDKRIEPGVRVELSRGDTLRVGGSSRVYTLHWIPLSKAYDFETSFVPSTYTHEEENSEQLDQGDNSLSVESKHIESPDSNSESKESLFSDEIVGLIGNKEIPSAQPMPDDVMFSICDQSKHVCESWLKDISGEHKEISGFWAFGTEAVNLFMNTEESHPGSKEYQCLQPHDVTYEVFETDGPKACCFSEKVWEVCPSSVQPPGETENQNPLGKDNGQTDNLCLSRGEILEETKIQLVEQDEASPAAQVPEISDNQSPLRKDHGELDISCLSSRPLVTGNLPLPIGEVPGEATYEHGEEEGLTTEPKSNMLVNLSIQHMDVKENQAYLAAQLPEEIDKTPLRKDDGQTDFVGLADIKDQHDVEESLISEPQSNSVNLEIEHINAKIKEACPAGQVPEIIDYQTSWTQDDGHNDYSCQLSGPLVMESLSLPMGEVLGETKDEQVAGESLTPEPKSPLLVNLNVEHSDVIGSLVDERLGETESKRLSAEDNEGRDVTSICSALHMTESLNSSPPDRVLSELIDEKENRTPQSLYTGAGKSESEFCESPPLRSENIRGSIWARRGKPASAVEVQTDKRRGKSTTDAGYDDEIEQEEEIFTPDKENFTPNTLLLRSLKKKGKLEVKHSKSRRSSSSKLTVVSNIHEQDLNVCPDKENQKLKRESVGTASENQARVANNTVTKVSRERMPFQSLLSNSGGKNRSEASVPSTSARSSASFSCTQAMEKATIPLTNKSAGQIKWGWTIVVDATTLLDKESRRSLQLLQGLKGTRLIIPKTVIRELDCLKQRGSLFRKKTEASLVLEWIEECMVETDWWIHVQSSIEDRRLIAPTPPVSPQSLFSENSWGFAHVPAASSLQPSRCRSFMDLVSPASEDHLLDCALLHRKMKNDGHLVLLSNDVTLKIKAMAEGLLCETAPVFRETLVNPSSERFLWPDSSPRGRTWSFMPDIILREKYNRCALKESSKVEGAKGLKLILLHNSHYGQIR